ncbi:hypothetical protein SPHINGO8BC_150364 [Sphingobacterium multivorum]|uniref:Uncharacterized protein n=1 Tax=Sphingobacterium multivorum TaxID=28454 RepID=A0A654AF72_SPHMU|nr:hypothetical protein SPHINGO8BC_150364 [Sphingobacterium multivorum]
MARSLCKKLKNNNRTADKGTEHLISTDEDDVYNLTCKCA